MRDRAEPFIGGWGGGLVKGSGESFPQGRACLGGLCANVDHALGYSLHYVKRN